MTDQADPSGAFDNRLDNTSFEFGTNFDDADGPYGRRPGVLGPSSTEQSFGYQPNRQDRYISYPELDRETDRVTEYSPSTYSFRSWDDEAASSSDYRAEFGPVSHRRPSAESAGSSEQVPKRRRGAHRLPAPTAALKGRAAVVAVAAGAVVSAGQAAVSSNTDTSPSIADVALSADAQSGIAATAMPQAAQFVDTAGVAVTPENESKTAPQLLNIAAPLDPTQFTGLIEKGQKFAQDRAAREAKALRPLFALPALGSYTSGFGARWGTLHAGVDIANAIGTPILAVADGTVIDAGPASGFGMWVRLKHADGTVTIYGHIDSATVTVGQQVMAGDEIAKMGNRGFSTGPHVHFEVWLNGTDKVDPLPWLASRGISLGVERD